jgi:hypothetical protein
MARSIQELIKIYVAPIKALALSGGKTLADLNILQRAQGNKLYVDEYVDKFLPELREPEFDPLVVTSKERVSLIGEEIHGSGHIAVEAEQLPTGEIKVAAYEFGLLGNIDAGVFVGLKIDEENNIMNRDLSKEDRLKTMANRLYLVSRLEEYYQDSNPYRRSYQSLLSWGRAGENEFCISISEFKEAYTIGVIVGEKIKDEYGKSIHEMHLDEIGKIKAEIFILTPLEKELAHAIANNNDVSHINIIKAKDINQKVSSCMDEVFEAFDEYHELQHTKINVKKNPINLVTVNSAAVIGDIDRGGR